MSFKLHQISQILNIQPEEKFNIRGRTETFYFSNEGLMKNTDQQINKNNFEKADDEILVKLLTGEYEIIENRFTPALGMIFYSYNRDWTVSGYRLNDYDLNYMCLYSLGMIFRTKEEALMKRDFYFKLLTGISITKFKKNNKQYPKDWFPTPKFNFRTLFNKQEETINPNPINQTDKEAEITKQIKETEQAENINTQKSEEDRNSDLQTKTESPNSALINSMEAITEEAFADQFEIVDNDEQTPDANDLIEE